MKFWGRKMKVITKSGFEIEMIKEPTDEDYMFMKKVCLNTIGKYDTQLQPTDEWIEKLLKCEHSPIRTLQFAFKMRIPYWVSVHFCRHKFGVEHFVSTQREDRVEDNRPRDLKAQGEIVEHVIYLNAQALINIMRKRLCNQASPETQEVAKAIKDLVVGHKFLYNNVLVPDCKYKGRCTEMFPCGRELV